MRHRSSGQSIVEMAFVLPVLLLVLFGIIEFGYIIFAYSTVSQAARNAAEKAAQLPPYQTWLDYKDQTGLPLSFTADACVRTIYEAATSEQTLFTNLDPDINRYITIRYPYGGVTRNIKDRGPIEVTISYPVTGITPLFRLLNLGGSTGTITLKVTQRRSIENLGEDPTKPGSPACAKDIADWNKMNPTP